jgi:lysophospholipase L1-like esterase
VVLSACGGGPTAPTPTPTPTPPVTNPPPTAAAPTLTCPAPTSTSTLAAAGTAVTFATPPAAGGQEPVTVSCTPASGSTFAIGTTQVACTATDALSRTASCSFPVTVSRIPQLSLTKFLAIGDSVTAGEVTEPITGAAPTSDGFPAYKLVVVPSAAYPTVLRGLLTARYPQQSISLVNEGLAGEGASEATAMPRFVSAMATHRPQVVLILTGYNDILGTGLIGLQEEAGAAAINAMAAEARNRNARVFIGLITPRRPGGRRAIPDSRIDAFNSRLRAIAAGENAIAVDLHTALSGNVNTYIGIDGLHPTEAGYRKIAETFLESIRLNLDVP